MRPRIATSILVFTCLVFTSCDQSARTEPDRVLPSARSGFALVYDSARQNLLLFGGSDTTNTRLGDTWTWTPDGWTAHGANGPSPRSDAQIAYDSRRNLTVLFGGLTTDGRSGETWTWDGATWTLADTLGPPPRQLGAMAFDEMNDAVVLFGGSGAGRTRLGDTWVWDGQRWVEESPRASPTPRGAHMMAYDADAGQILLVGGYDGATRHDTWAWNGMDWTLVDTTNTPPRLHSSLVHDALTGRMLMFGGFGASERESELWERRDGQWQMVDATGPEVRAEHDGAFVEDVGYVVFGGVVGQEMATSERRKSNDVWIFSDATWRRW